MKYWYLASVMMVFNAWAMETQKSHLLKSRVERVKTYEDIANDPKNPDEFKCVKDNKRRSMSVDSGTISLLIQEVSGVTAYFNDEKQGALKKQKSSEELDPLNQIPTVISSLKIGE